MMPFFYERKPHEVGPMFEHQSVGTLKDTSSKNFTEHICKNHRAPEGAWVAKLVGGARACRRGCNVTSFFVKNAIFNAFCHVYESRSWTTDRMIGHFTSLRNIVTREGGTKWPNL